MATQTRCPLQWPAGWPRTGNPARSRFGKWNSKPTIAAAGSFLSKQIELLTDNTDFILSTNLKYRTDGMPYSNQRQPDDQGAAVYFKFEDKDMVIACDTFDKIGCNIYAIGLTIEAMRGISRWGCSELMNRAFTGFQALPEKASAPSCFTILGVDENATVDDIKYAYRTLSRIYHPDVAETGNAERFIQIKAAYEDALTQKEVIV